MKIAIIDIETTGFNPQTDCIVEIGIVELCLETGQKRVLYDKVVKEKHYSATHANSWIYSNSTLTHEKVNSAQEFDLDEVQKILSDYKVTAYNKKFDFSFLSYRGLEFEELDCPMVIAAPVCKIPGNYGHKWPTLSEAYNVLIGDGYYIEEHRGILDAMVGAEIVHKLYQLGHFKT